MSQHTWQLVLVAVLAFAAGLVFRDLVWLLWARPRAVIAKPTIEVSVRASASGHVVDAPSRKQRIRRGAQVASCSLDGVDGDLEAAAELVVELLTHRKAEAA